MRNREGGGGGLQMCTCMYIHICGCAMGLSGHVLRVVAGILQCILFAVDEMDWNGKCFVSSGWVSSISLF